MHFRTKMRKKTILLLILCLLSSLLKTFIIWLAPRAGKMKRTLCSDWVLERARLGIARFGPTNKRLLGAGLRSSLTLQNETVYKTLSITSI